MLAVPKKIEKRLAEGTKRYKRIVANAAKKDVNESDTVTIVVDMLSDIFGYDKFTEVTSEYAIRKTYCDLAIKLGSKTKLLIECKAVGTKLKDDHARQVIDYGTKEGVDWVVLTNAIEWKVYKIIFRHKPIMHDLVYCFTMGELDIHNREHISFLYALSKESIADVKPGLWDIYEHQSMVNKYMVGQLILHETTIAHIRRLLKKISPEVKVGADKIAELVETEVLKRDILDSENIKDIKRFVRRKLLTSPKTSHNAEPKE